MVEVHPSEIERAAVRIAPHIRQTPLLTIEPGELSPARLILKLETLQKTGSFKVRGAFNTVLKATPGEAGIVAASGGNHGIAVAYAARSLGFRAEIFVPEIASPVKVNRLRALGAEVHQTGERYADSLAAMRERQAITGAFEVHAYDQADVLSGQGTLAREFEAAAPPLDRMVIAVGGGGLVGGALAWLQNRLEILAVEPQTSMAMGAALTAGTPVDVDVSGVAADSLGARRIGQISFDLALTHKLQAIQVSDEAIRKAQRWLYEHCRIVTEPGGATAFAAVLEGGFPVLEGETLGIVLCGSNADPASLG